MDITVRTIEPAEAAPFARATQLGLLSHPAPGESEWRAGVLEPSRCWAAFDQSMIVGTLFSLPGELTVPGGLLPASKISGVGVLSTHRRRGLLTEMITADLRASVWRGEPLAVLIAAEHPIYGRYGFGPATVSRSYTIDASRARLRAPQDGVVLPLEGADARRHMVAAYERFRRRQPGALDRPARFWDVALGDDENPGKPHQPAFHVGVLDDAGEPDGYLTYRVEPAWRNGLADSTLRLVELIGASPQAEARLWRHCLEVDWVRSVQAPDRRAGELLRHLLVDPGVMRLDDEWSNLWLRLLDAPAALAGRRYPVAGRLVIEIADPLGHADGRYLLDGGPDGATCEPTSAPADLTAPVDVLGSLYLGGGSATLLAAAGRLAEHRPGAVALAEAMFGAGIEPWSNTWF